MAFTEKGLVAIKTIMENYTEEASFTAADLKVAPATLTSLAKDGYLIRQNTKPVSYVCDAGCRERINSDFPKEFKPYSKEELKRQTKMTYSELVDYCINKYGRVSGPYFCTPEFKSTNSKIKRGDEGLYVHHIKEDSAIMLSHPAYAREQPWDYQMPHNLVYCNIFEHLLLHICIVHEYEEVKMQNSQVLPGIGGIMNYIYPILEGEYEDMGSFDTIENISYIQYKKIIRPMIKDIKKTSLYNKFMLNHDNFIDSFE